jgi:hypothetical protein
MSSLHWGFAFHWYALPPSAVSNLSVSSLPLDCYFLFVLQYYRHTTTATNFCSTTALVFMSILLLTVLLTYRIRLHNLTTTTINQPTPTTLDLSSLMRLLLSIIYQFVSGCCSLIQPTGIVTGSCVLLQQQHLAGRYRLPQRTKLSTTSSLSYPTSHQHTIHQLVSIRFTTLT